MIQLSSKFYASTGRHVSTRVETTKHCNFKSDYTTLVIWGGGIEKGKAMFHIHIILL